MLVLVLQLLGVRVIMAKSAVVKRLVVVLPMLPSAQSAKTRAW